MRVMQYAGARVRGGLLDHVAMLVGGLRAAGHEVHAVLAPVPAVDDVAGRCEAAGARVTRLTVKGKTDLHGLLRLRRLVARRRPDVFHLHLSSPIEALPAVMAARWGGAKRLITTEHAPTWFPLCRPYSHSAKRMASRWLDAVIALSDADASFLKEEFGVEDKLLAVIPNGVDACAEPPSRAEAKAALGLQAAPEGLLGCAAALEEKKGLLDLVAAVRECGLTGWGLVLAGEGSLEDELRREAARSAFPVLLTGHLPGLDTFLAAVDLFVLPSHQEAMPLALLAAMAAGLPIIATRVGGVGEAIEHEVTGILVDPSRPDQIVAALRRLVADPGLARRLGMQAKRKAESSFSARRMVRDVEALYKGLEARSLGRSA